MKAKHLEREKIKGQTIHLPFFQKSFSQVGKLNVAVEISNLIDLAQRRVK
jgi:hypothetical protein